MEDKEPKKKTLNEGLLEHKWAIMITVAIAVFLAVKYLSFINRDANDDNS